MLTLFGSIAVGVMMFSYWLEVRSKWFVLAFAAGSGATKVDPIIKTARGLN